uniref:Uncharacterized protein n=1 Tax=Myoviridae sp. ctKhy9 TaxID=2827677 RepID=A0A8S5SL05_9CAUD|nr:MAG TPA: hypothetical protein [Myoviridae sp. ctKhy9]
MVPCFPVTLTVTVHIQGQLYRREYGFRLVERELSV